MGEEAEITVSAMSQQEAEQQVADTLEHNRDYALERAYEVCADYGLSDA